MRLIRSLAIAFSTYSRIPMPQVEWSEENQRYSMCFFPLVGLAVGLLQALWLCASSALGVGPLLRGAFAAVLPLLVTGGIHMDGFMDTSDAIASWQPKERRLEILKDSHTGAFAVIGCAGYLLMSAGVLGELSPALAPAAALCYVLSRALSALAMTHFAKARKSGMLSDMAQTLQKRAVTWACAAFALLCSALFVLLLGWKGLLPVAAAAGCMLYYRKFSDRYFGGVTGDLAGWFLQISEICMLSAVLIGGLIP